MLEAPAGPVLLKDFPDDDPRAQPDPAWRPPLPKAELGDGSAEALAAALEAEAPRLADTYARARTQHNGRTTVGLSGLAPEAAARYVAQFLRGRPVESPHPDMSPVLALRFAADDLKAYYTEAAGAGSAKPASRQVGDWFWHDTAAGAAFQALRKTHLDSADDRLKLIATMFLVPGARVPAS